MPLDYETLPTIEAIIDTLIDLLILPTETWTELQLQDLQTIHQSALQLQAAWWGLAEAKNLTDVHLILAYTDGDFHYLRTAVNSMIGFARVILKGIDGPIPTEHQQAIEMLYHNGSNLLQKINDIWQRRTAGQRR